jgi:hypothetical protein
MLSKLGVITFYERETKGEREREREYSVLLTYDVVSFLLCADRWGEKRGTSVEALLFF